MAIVPDILEALGGPTAIYRQTGIPVQTVADWKRNGNIPHWRRSTLIEAAKKLEKPLAPPLLAYLASTDPAPTDQAAAA